MLIGARTAAWNAGGLLPPEYKQVEYLGCTGSQYIETGLRVSEEFVDIQYEIEYDTILKHEESVIGNYSGGFTCGIKDYYNVEFMYCYTSGGLIRDVTLEADVKYKVRFLLDNFVAKLYVDDTFIVSKTIGSVGTSSRTLKIFNRGDLNATFFTGRLFSLEVKNSSDESILNVVPCFRKLDTKPGFYDLAQDRFLTNNGSGTDFVLPT